MKRYLHAWLLWTALGMLLSGGSAAAGDEGLLVIVHPSVKVDSLSADSLSAIFTLTKRAWGGGGTIIPYNYDSSSKVREQFDRVVLNFTPAQAARYWVDYRIRGGGSAPPKVPSISLMVRVIAHLPGAIGYVPVGTPLEGTKVVARIMNDRVVPVGGR
jgi:ABC-type phosphate transport system substrate-binding protein